MRNADHDVDHNEVAFYRLDDRIFIKNWIMSFDWIHESNFHKFFDISTSMDKRVYHVINRLNAKMQKDLYTKISSFGYRGLSEPSPPLFVFSGERLHTLCGLTDEDLGDMMSYLDEFEFNRNFLRSLTIKEAVTALFYLLRQNSGLNVLREHINDKKSTLNNHCVIKSETISNSIYKIAFVLGGPNKTPHSELKGQFYRSFHENRIFRNTLRPIGSFTTDFLGWRQSHLKPDFLLGDACTALHKCEESLSSLAILDYYKSFSDTLDENIKIWSDGMIAKNLSIAVDASYLYCKKPDDMDYAKRLYSMHKKRHLTKFMLYVSSMGYIYDLSTSWATDGAHNDAKILQLEMTQNENLKLFFAEMKAINMKITMIGDRGFRDALQPTLKLFSDSVQLIIPPLQQNQLNDKGKPKASKRNTGNKLSNQKANDARILCQKRSIIENMNMMFKTFAAFRDIVELEYVFNGFQGTCLRIVASILNRRFKRKGWIQRDSSPKMFRLDLLKSYYVTRYKENRHKRVPNLMFVQTNAKFFTFHKKGSDLWRNIGPNSTFFDNFKAEFPSITFTSIKEKNGEKTTIADTDLVHFTLGEYHCLNARKYLCTEQYTSSHFFMQELNFPQNETLYSTEFKAIYSLLLEKYPDWIKRRYNILRFLVPAQFSPSEHKVFIIYSKNTEISSDIEDEPDYHFLGRIIDFYCDCKTGARSLGCCSHVCAALLGARGEAKYVAKHAGREVLDEKTYQRTTKGADDTVISEPPELEPIIFTEKPDELASEPEDQSENIANFEKELRRIDNTPISDSQEKFRR